MTLRAGPSVHPACRADTIDASNKAACSHAMHANTSMTNVRELPLTLQTKSDGMQVMCMIMINDRVDG